MEEGKKRKREIVLLSITIVLASAALIVQVLFGKEGLLRKKFRIHQRCSYRRGFKEQKCRQYLCRWG